jgi:hypothetical protein
MTDLTPQQLAEAQHEGLSEDEYRVMRTVLERDAAARNGLTHEEFVELMRVGHRAAARGYGISIAEWQTATHRDAAGRKVAK